MKTYVFVTFDQKVYTVKEATQREALIKLETELGKILDIKISYLVTREI